QRVVHGMALRLADVVHPGLVVAHRIDAKADHLGVAAVELAFQPRPVAELGGAHGREVLRMREEDRPLVADPLVEADAALGRVRGEIGGYIADANRHGTLLSFDWSGAATASPGVRPAA